MKKKAIKVLKYAIDNKGIDKETMQKICGKDYGAVLAFLNKSNVGTWGIGDRLINTNDNAELVIYQLRSEIRSSYKGSATFIAAIISAIAACVAAYNGCALRFDNPPTLEKRATDIRKDSKETPRHGDSLPALVLPCSPSVRDVKCKGQAPRTSDSAAHYRPLSQHTFR